MRPIETKTVTHNDVALTVNIYPDDVGTIDDYFCDDTIKVAYLKKSRYVLGTQAVSEEEMDEIGAGIRSGEYIGLPVYAYVHSGIALSTGSFGCPWDSGQSGFVYMKATDARQYGDALAALRSTVEEMGKLCNGEVYGYEILDEEGNHVDSCWGFIGDECVMDEALRSADYYAKSIEEERATESTERLAWAARGVVTA